jgi:non-canonical poly(A) RNA polymerase PAPD5/7
MHLSNITEKDKRTTSLGTLLLDFFGLYGVYFNYKRIGIDTTEGGSYVPNDDSYDPPAASSYKGLEGTSLMTIDPNDEYNNVTKNCWNFSGVRNAFKYAFSALTSLNHSKTEGSFLCSIIRVTQDLIERRVWVHGDEQYRAYCARNLIPYALTHQKDNWSKHLSEKQTKKKSKSKGSMRDKKISKKRKRYDEDDRDDEDRRRKRVRNDRL